MIVADASVLLEALVGGGPRAEVVRGRLGVARQVHVPHGVDLEVAHALRRLVARELVGEALAVTAIDQLQRLPLNRYPHVPFLDRIWELRATVTPYDAAYVALAEAVDAPLITLDQRLAGATGPACPIEVIG
ncbi:MAG: PIN domain-containing protein [Acidimicrobiia bacterium]|nr:MAG: PIN domain-containing protein [Acidimicrobiia bacterium]